VIETVETSVMKSAARPGTPKAGTVLSPSLSVRPLSCAFSTLRSVMAKTIVVMALMKRLNSAVSSVHFIKTKYNLFISTY